MRVAQDERAHQVARNGQYTWREARYRRPSRHRTQQIHRLHRSDTGWAGGGRGRSHAVALPTTIPVDVADRIAQACGCHTDLADDHVSVMVDGNRVTLSDTVSTRQGGASWTALNVSPPTPKIISDLLPNTSSWDSASVFPRHDIDRYAHAVLRISANTTGNMCARFSGSWQGDKTCKRCQSSRIIYGHCINVTLTGFVPKYLHTQETFREKMSLPQQIMAQVHQSLRYLSGRN